MKNDFSTHWSFAVRNVFRHRLRTAATLAAISIGVVGLILSAGFVEDIFVQLGEAIIHSQTGHVQVTREGYRDGKGRSPESFLIAQPEELKAELAKTPGVKSVIARLGFVGMLNNGRRDLGVVGEGIDPQGEADLGTYLRFVEGRALSDADIDGIVVGQGVAKTLGIKVGDRITLVMSLAQGAINTLDFELVGVFESFSKEFDARAVRIPLAAAGTLMDTQGVHTFVVNLGKTRDTARVAETLKQRWKGRGFEIVKWNELSDFYDKTLLLYDRQFGILRFIILLMVLLSVTNSVNMTLFERTREFGTLLALGDRSAKVFRLIMTESLVVGILGALIGISLGCLAALLISAIGIPMPPPPNSNMSYIAIIRLVPAQVAGAGAIGFFAAWLAAIAPARRASRLNVVDALRHGQ